MRKPVLSIAILLMLLSGVGCGSDSSTDDSSSESTSSKPFRFPDKEAPVRYEKKMKVDSSGLVGPEPKPVIPKSDPPDFLALTDLIEGIGQLSTSGKQVTVQYAGYDYETGEKFASSWEQGKPVTFTLGTGEVIDGWEEGILGMEIGDRRELVIPPDLTEGSYPPGTPEGKTVVFVIDSLPASAAPKAEKASAPEPAKKEAAPKKAKASKKTKPKVVPPKGPAPKDLVVKDLEVGTGPAAKAGDELTVQYVGVGYESGKQFDASWDRGEPFTFELGGGGLIKGWEEGLEGMKVGGRRELITPPDFAYGPAGSETIAPNATLVFVIDLLAIK